jgi:hypothetical protein
MAGRPACFCDPGPNVVGLEKPAASGEVGTESRFWIKKIV